MHEKRLESLEVLQAQRMKEYQDFKQAESMYRAKASVRIQQVKDILKTIPQDIQVRLNLVPEKDIEEMSFDEIKAYGEKVEKSFTFIADKIEAYLTTGDIGHLSGIEEAVGVAVAQVQSQQPQQVQQPFTVEPSEITIEVEKDPYPSTPITNEGSDIDPFSVTFGGVTTNGTE